MKKQSIALDLILSIITLGLYNFFWVQIRQILDTNELLQEERFSYLQVLIFTILTLGLYFCYHEYLLTKTLHFKISKQRYVGREIACLLGSFLGLSFIVDAYQQQLLNEYIQGLAAHGTTSSLPGT